MSQEFGTLKPGDIKYQDVNDDGVINSDDKIAIGYSTTAPEIYYSFHLGAEWKGLGVDAMFQGTANYSAVLNTKAMYWPTLDSSNLSTYYYENRWTPGNTNARFPRLTSEKNANNHQTSTVWVVDRSFLKLRNLEVYYKLPKNLMKKSGFVKNAKLYIRGIDLLCFDGMDVVDPESYGTTAPLNKSVVFGLNIGF